MGWDGVWNGEGGWGWGVRGERVGARWGTKRRSRDAAPPRRRAVAVRGGQELIKAAVPLRCAALRARRQPGSTPPRTAPQPPPPPMVLPGPPGMARSEEVHRLTENVYKVSPATGAGPRGASPASPPSPLFHLLWLPYFSLFSLPLLRRARGQRGVGARGGGGEGGGGCECGCAAPPPLPARRPHPQPHGARGAPGAGAVPDPPRLCVGMGAGQPPPLTPSPGHFGPPFPFSRHLRAVSAPLSSAAPHRRLSRFAFWFLNRMGENAPFRVVWFAGCGGRGREDLSGPAHRVGCRPFRPHTFGLSWLGPL